MHRKGNPVINRITLFFLNTLSLFFKKISFFILLVKSLRKKEYPGAIIISVNNLSFGGTGKTPMVIAIARGLEEKELNFSIVSRGYKAALEKKGVRVSGNHTPQQVGDEAAIFHKRFPNQDIFIGKNRHISIRKALKRGNRFIILDDGFQSTDIHRDIKIMLFNPHHPYYYLRNFKWLMKDEDFILVYTSLQMEVANNSMGRGHYYFKHQGFFNSREERVALKNEAILGFSALGDNLRFKKDLENFNLVHFTGFPDHHEFSEKDLETLEKQRKMQNASYLVCTEKDYMKLFQYNLSDFPLIYARNVIEFDLDLVGYILDYAKNKKKDQC